MGLATLYEEKKSALAPPANEVPYEQIVFNMERKGVNDLVVRYQVDTLYRPPLVPSSYIARLFEQREISQL